MKQLTSLLIKPVGANCNSTCSYCFYAKRRKGRMLSGTLQQLHAQLLAVPNAVCLNWQGGEPTLMGLPFYEKAVALQQHLHNFTFNTLQTNGLLLDARWVAFLKQHNFVVGLSLDGSEALHNIYRRDWQLTIDTLKRLQDANVETHILCTINNVTVERPHDIIETFQRLDVSKVQFIRVAEQPYAPSAKLLGQFMIVTHDLATREPDCTTQPVCGDYLVIDYDGNVYSCDFYCDEDHLLGDVFNDDLRRMLTKSSVFGTEKMIMNGRCYICPWLRQCYGGCPRERRNGLNMFCEGFKAYFEWKEVL